MGMKMTILRHELKQGARSLAVWTAAISAFIAVCVFLYPEMEEEMAGVGKMFADMGAFSAAFGMDRLNFGSFIGFYAVECGNILGIGGALFAALIGVSALSKEEKERTAEFLLTHPVSRRRIIFEKLAAVMAQIVMLNGIVFGLSTVLILLIGEAIPWKEVTLLHLAYLLLQAELAAVCFGISAFLRRSGMGAGLGLAIAMYFLNLIANLTQQAEFLKYMTPFAYAEGADIIENLALDARLLAPGLGFTCLGIALAFWQYGRKDILV